MDPVAPPSAPASPPSTEDRFSHLYAEHGRDLFAYALRRVDDPEDAADVLSETFVVAWRRIEDVPAGREARLWLYGVARRIVANQRRGARRRRRLDEQLRGDLAETLAAAPEIGGELKSALERLEPADRELLRLTAWEELEPAEAAKALGITSVAARSRLHRARHRLRRELDRTDTPNETRLRPEEGR